MGVRRHASSFGTIWFKMSTYWFYGVAVSVLLSLILFCSVTAKSFSEYLEAFFYVMICILLLWWFTIFKFHKNEHTNLIRNLEAIIQKRMENELHGFI